MDPPPPYDLSHHRRSTNHYPPDQHHHFPGGSGGGSRHDYDVYERLPAPYHALPPSDYNHHHQPRLLHHQQLPPPPPLPQHRHEASLYAPPLPAPPEPYSPPPSSYHNPAHHHQYHQRHGDEEIRHVSGHHHHPQRQHQLPWDEVEDDRHHYALSVHQLRLSPSGSRKRQRCMIHDVGDLESTSSSGPTPRHPRQQQPRANYAPVSNFVDRTTTHPVYVHEGILTHSDCKGSRKMQIPAQMTLPGSPHAMIAGHPRRTPQKPAPRRLSVWQRIEENPVSPRLLPKAVHISPCKSNNAGSVSKELPNMISVDFKGKSSGSNDSDSAKGINKEAGRKIGKVLSSVLVKPSPQSKENEGTVEKITGNHDNVQKNVVGPTSKSLGLTARPGAGAKKVKKIVIKKIVRKIGGKGKQISSSVISEKRDIIDASANACEKEEGEIITSSFEGDVISEHNLVSTSDTAGATKGADAQNGGNNNLKSPLKRKAASATESAKNIDSRSISYSEHPGKEYGRSSNSRRDNSGASAIESTKVLDTSRGEHHGKEDWVSMDSGVRYAACLVVNDNPQKEEGEILSLSGEMNVAVTSNNAMISDGCEDCSIEESRVPNGTSGNSTLHVDGVAVNHDTSEVSGSGDHRRESNNILIGTNKENDLRERFFFVGPSTTEVTICVKEGAQKIEGMILNGSGEKSISSLSNAVETPMITEVSASQDGREGEGNLLNNPSEKVPLSVSSCGAPNTTEVSANKVIQDKQGRITMQSSASGGHNVKALNIMELSMNEDTKKKESQVPTESCETNTFQIIHPLETHNTEKSIVNKFVGREVGKSLVGSNGVHSGISSDSMCNPEFNLAGGTKDSRMRDLLNSKIATNETDASLVVEGTYFFNLPSSRNDTMVDSISDIILNNGVEKNCTGQIAELMHLHRGHLSPENEFMHSRESSCISGNSKHSVPTALTLASNFYFSNTESEGQPEENHVLVEGQQGLDAATVTEFDSPGKRKRVADHDLISAGVKYWLTLPPSVNNIAMHEQLLINDSTVGKDRLDLDQSVDGDTFVSQDHDITQDMDQFGSVNAFSSQVNSIRLCGSDRPQSDLLTPKGISGDVENYSGIVLSGLHSTSSINALERHDYQMVDIPVGNPIEPVLPASESTHVMDAGLVSSQVSVDPDQTYHSNTEGPVVDSSEKQDMLSSWIEAIVSEAKKEHQPCKSNLPSISLPAKLLAPKEDLRRAVLDSVVKSPQMNFTSSMPHKVTPKQVSLPSSSRDPPRLSQNARHKTWHRGDMSSSTSSVHASQPSGLPPKQVPRKNGEAQNSYIRKGNALIRNPVTGNPPSISLDAQIKLNKPVMRRSMNFVRKVDSNDSVAHSNISVERPTTPPLSLHAKSFNSTTDLSEQLSNALHKQHVPETKNDDSTGQLNSGVDNPSIKIAQKSENLDANKVVYVRPKSNQLVAAQKQHPDDLIRSSMDKVLPLQPPTTSDFYFKKRKNQIILNSSSDGQNKNDMPPAESLYSGENKGLSIASLNNSTTGLKDRSNKALKTASNTGRFSHVWTLSGQQPQRKGFAGTSYMKVFPRILPWKRKIYYKKFTSSHTQNTSSLRIVRKLLQTKKRDVIYTVSTDGFSIRKSALLSVGGSSLKWSRSLEKRSQKVHREATQAVADVERKKREKRKRQSLCHIGRNDQYSVSVAGSQLRNNNQSSLDLRSSARNEYVRVSKGNQLVRNPKKVICMLANEKVRWSLHTVRSRLAKKQQYCQFFTRFGVCKKPEGKCRYIHDHAKVTICTKFLKGLCSDTSCKLTHKVLPERMQDCSYFLRGLCTNTACPYRHVKVNSNAPACEDFLKGYCEDGDECHRKHSYACPVFEATGECPEKSKCKLHHPKKQTKSKRSRPEVPQNSSWGRYFDTSIDHDSDARKVSSDEYDREKLQHVSFGADFVDFIRLGADADEGVTEVHGSDDIQLMDLDTEDLSAQADHLDELIKPLRIMRTARI